MDDFFELFKNLDFAEKPCPKPIEVVQTAEPDKKKDAKPEYVKMPSEVKMKIIGELDIASRQMLRQCSSLEKTLVDKTPLQVESLAVISQSRRHVMFVVGPGTAVSFHKRGRKGNKKKLGCKRRVQMNHPDKGRICLKTNIDEELEDCAFDFFLETYYKNHTEIRKVMFCWQSDLIFNSDMIAKYPRTKIKIRKLEFSGDQTYVMRMLNDWNIIKDVEKFKCLDFTLNNATLPVFQRIFDGEMLRNVVWIQLRAPEREFTKSEFRSLHCNRLQIFCECINITNQDIQDRLKLWDTLDLPLTSLLEFYHADINAEVFSKNFRPVYISSALATKYKVAKVLMMTNPNKVIVIQKNNQHFRFVVMDKNWKPYEDDWPRGSHF